MDVRFVYQPYAENMAIFIDNRPIGMISALSKYQTQPFAVWCDHILPAVATEVNDIFDLTYVGRKCEYDLLKQYIAQCPNCLSIKYEPPVIGETALLRLKKLSRLSMSGVSVNKFAAKINIYTDAVEGAIEEITRSVLPKLSFCRFAVVVHPLSDLQQATDRANTMAIVMADVNKDINPNIFGMICLGATQYRCQNGVYYVPGSEATFADNIANLLELGYYPQLLRQALSQTSIPSNSSFFPEVFILDKIEPQTVVKIPQSIEYGETAQIQLSTIPKSAKVPDVFCKVSNDAVVTYSKEGLKAVGTGEAIVEVYEQGKTIPLCTGKVTAYRRNRIRSLSIQPSNIKMCVGETAQLSCSFSPSDADNASAIRLISRDGTIAAITGKNSITAKRTGSCTLLYEADKISSAPCNVEVYPKLERLEIEMENSTLSVNDLAKVRIKRYPSDATLDNLSVRIEPSSLGTYDVGSGSIYARQAGTGKIVVQSDRSNVSHSYPVEVKPASAVTAKHIAIGIGIAAIAVIAWFFLR